MNPVLLIDIAFVSGIVTVLLAWSWKLHKSSLANKSEVN